MTPAVEQAVAELRAAFAGHKVEATPEGQGGAYVIVHDLHLGDQYRPTHSWVGFLIAHTYPYADVYPHFTSPDFARADGAALGEGIAQTPWRDQPATQLSRRSNHWNATADTAAVKLSKVLEWLRSR